jgi:hypothetical protein
MVTFEVTEIISESDIPASTGRKGLDYSSLTDKFDRIGAGKTLVIPIEKKHHSNGIQNAFAKKYGKTAFKFATRTDKETGAKKVYITRVD